ncbi:MFS transporter [Allostreptomyces psammosilenae]|uniref:NNP family nitrate/nitrite transporter-like MFS transporter n=1 Tax=Allostreptomyces psammosilenae TaxID=1892865 RepID=A0A853A4C6_9ACTN|nr:nitrate/nitrite transporter [Allostreptomyces psammosilenae]NYI05352.1 NNP family nitrate/nitrite transporter-like MFS transporter [Allostreptomyces psammosilenae]
MTSTDSVTPEGGRLAAEPATSPVTVESQRRGSRWIADWEPEDPEFWESTGRRIARRNLYHSVVAEHFGFAVWSLWSVLVLFMTAENGFSVTPDDKFLLVSMVTLVGAVLRLPYSFAVARFGGRNWTVFSALSLLVPTVAAALMVRNPDAPLWAFTLVAVLAGIGGGNFASSMTNINQFFPEREKGWALGLNAGAGNLGVAVVQLVGLLVIAVAGTAYPEIVPVIFLPFVLLAGFLAWRYMDNLVAARTNYSSYRAVLRDRHCWLISFLYIGTFGSFIGFGFAFGLVLQNDFGRTPLQAASLTFLGPLLGSFSRPLGGSLADRFGGARVTLWTFVAMVAGTGVVLAASFVDSLPVFIAGFIVVFVLTGIGNGSTYKMIPGIYAARAESAIGAGADPAAARAEGRRRSGAVIGIAGAVGALGGMLINLTFRESYNQFGDATGAIAAFLVYYVACIVVTSVVYLRRPSSGTAGGSAVPAQAPAAHEVV